MTTNRTSWRRLIPAVVLSTVAGVAAWADGRAPADPADVEAGHPTGHLHDHADQAWPPQPRGITNVVPLSDPGGAERAAELRQRQKAKRERVALASPDVRKSLGRRYTRPDLVESDGKGVVNTGTVRLVYFSLENNTTVEVTLDKSRVLGVREIAATEYQPDVTDDEILEAEGIARAYFNDRGTARVAALRAYGILAYLPQGTGFYPVRVIYLSFHEAEDAPPEFSAWVDLSNQRVLRIREEPS
ncbi:MAG: hypothetical protein E4H19_13640 [Chromatiales bacterium]|jgi:hypothetical protein|nr:MAG: hypothetical protein E4H19_13640 [Chromatiales bacterium]